MSLHSLRIVSSTWVITFASIVTSVPVLAAPPEASTLFPSGGKVGESVTVAIGGNVKPWPVQAWTDDKHLTIEAEKKEGQVVIKIGKDAEPGVHWLRFMNADGASSPRAFVVGTLPELTEKEPNNELTKAALLSGPTTINGRLGSAGDVDVFGVELSQGQTLVVDVDAEIPLNSPVDSVLQVVDSGGFVLAQNNDDVGLDPRIVFIAPKPGKYYARLFGYSSTPSSAVGFGGGDTFIYRMTITTGPFIDYAYPLAVKHGESTQVDLLGWSIGKPASMKLKLDNSVSSARAFFGAAAGYANVLAVDVPVMIEKEPNDAKQAQTITLPIAISGRCDTPGDVDVFAFDAKKGQRIFAKVESRVLGFVTDPVIMLLDSTEKIMTTVDDTDKQRDSELATGISADGRYRLLVRDLYRHGSPRHAYLLTIRVDEADYQLSLAATETVLDEGKSVELPVTIDRRPGFNEEIAFEVRGLPEGVKVDAPKSAAKGETAKSVKLKLSGGKSPWSGAIQIVGISQGDKKLERIASGKVVNYLGVWTQLWLTVKK